MKNSLLVFTMILFCPILYGQKSELGFVVNGGTSKLFFDINGEEIEHFENSFGFSGSFGLIYNYNLTEKVNLCVGFKLEKIKGTFKSEDDFEFPLVNSRSLSDTFTFGFIQSVETIGNRYDLHYISIPLNVSYQFGKFSLYSGIKPSFHLYSYVRTKSSIFLGQVVLFEPYPSLSGELPILDLTYKREAVEDLELKKNVFFAFNSGINYQLNKSTVLGFDLNMHRTDALNHTVKNTGWIQSTLSLQYFLIKK